MVKLADREEDILDYIIRDYVKNAEPVSSGRISKSGILKLSPATIRNAMLRLDEEGFLGQPHTSSGRVPTDKAYRYFVNNLMELKEPQKKEQDKIDGMVREARGRHERSFENFVRSFSRELGLFAGVAAFREPPMIEGFGLEKVFSEPEFDDRNLMVGFSSLVDNLERVAQKFLEEAEDYKMEVFIGDENPISKARDFSAVVMKFSDRDFGQCIIFSMGPKRMNYERATSLINFVVRDLTR